MNQEYISLDFWQDTVTYGGKCFPTGTLACDALNIPEAVIEQLEPCCKILRKFMESTNAGRGDPTFLPTARESARQIAILLKDVKPFSCFDEVDAINAVEQLFSEEALANVSAYQIAVLTGGINNINDPRYDKGMRLLRVLPILAQLDFTLKQYRETMLAFAEKLDDPEQARTPESYARQFGECFSLVSFSDAKNTWMAMTNVSLKYKSVVQPDSAVPKLVKRMTYISFVGMFRSDLFEGLRVGHAPKKCRICGRWFLTTDARHTKYCGGYAPGDMCHRTCRQLGNLKGREARELAQDNPVHKLYKQLLNTVNHRKGRHSIDPELAQAVKKLAKDKFYRAKSNAVYANGAYRTEMEISSLIEEVSTGL